MRSERLWLLPNAIQPIALSLIADTFISFFPLRPIFCKLFKIAFPFMSERLEDWDDQD